MDRRVRPRTSASAREDPPFRLLSELPEHLLTTVSSLLPAPESALLAVSFAPSAAAGSPAALRKVEAIVAGREGSWDVLDYGEVPELAARLTDADLAASLRIVDAGRRVRTLRLTGCLDVTGAGLRPLMGSTAIEVVDLSLTRGGDNPRLRARRPMISFREVLPTLVSFMSRPYESRLRQLVLPKKWRSSGSFALDQFLELYNNHLDRKGFACTRCDQNCLAMSNGDQGEVTWRVDDWVSRRREGVWSGWIGMQHFGCQGCNDTICYRCDWLSQTHELKYCHGCEKEHCRNCVSDYWRCPNPNCRKELCGACRPDESPVSCAGCRRQVRLTECSACQPRCDSCGDVYCDTCSDAAHLQRCDGCDDKICMRCRRDKCREDFSTCCTQCLRIVTPYLESRLID